MTWFMFFCLWLAVSNTNNGYANAIIFVAWSVLVYMLAINGAFKDWGDLYLNEPTKSEKRLISSARKYLEPVKTVDEQIKSIAKEIEQLRCNITSISAIDYSKDRVSGGGVPCGLESSVARFIDTEKEQRRRIDELSEYKCDVINTINSLSEEIGGTMLRYEYLLGMSAKQAHSVFENQFNERQAMRYKEKALIEIGRLKCQ